MDLVPYGNYEVESITLIVENAYNSSVQLLVNGVVEDSITSPSQIATLYPAFLTDANDPYLRMDLGVRGTMYISYITVQLRSM